MIQRLKYCATCRDAIRGPQILFRKKKKGGVMFFCSAACNVKNLEGRTDPEGQRLYAEAVRQMVRLNGGEGAMKFCHKPTVVEAMRSTGVNGAEICQWAATEKVRFESRSKNGVSQHVVMLETATGLQIAEAGDWVIQGASGCFYPVEAERFHELYEPGETAPTPAPNLGLSSDEELFAELEQRGWNLTDATRPLATGVGIRTLCEKPSHSATVDMTAALEGTENVVSTAPPPIENGDRPSGVAAETPVGATSDNPQGGGEPTTNPAATGTEGK